MVDILSYFPTTENVFTIRLTPFKHYTISDIVTVFNHKTANMSKVLLFQEGGTEHQRIHFHARLETELSRSGMNKWITRNFRLLKGNACRSIHTCKVGNLVKDKNLLKSATYIAKEGDLKFSKGYSTTDIKKLINIGQKLLKDSKMPLYKKVISYNQLLPLKCDFPSLKDLEKIQKSISKYYEKERNLPYPIGRIGKTLMAQILCTLSPPFLEHQMRKERYHLLHDEY